VQQNINEEWTNIKDAILEAATEIITTKQVIERNAWWVEECRDAIKQKNEAREKCLQRRTRSNQENYEQKRKIANNICRQKKKAWMYTKLKDVEMANKKNDTKKFYKAVQNLSRGPPLSLQICKDEAGKLLIEKEEILKRWKQYFEQMMKQDITHISQETEITAQEHENVQMISPTCKEISNVIDKLKSDKSPGPDNIIPEFIKYGGTGLKRRIYYLICKIWENEILPDEWLKGIICPVFKKGDPKLCKNYRAITLLNVVYKVFSSYLYNKLSEIVKTKSAKTKQVLE
jgi:hypothetical protein